MSPRGFKIGLALFLAMSGLFIAKVAMPAGGLLAPLAALWSNAKSSVGRTTAAISTPAASEKTAATSAAVPLPSDDVAAAKAAESAAHTAAPLSESDHSLVAAINLELRTRGYDPGASEPLGLQARAAIMAYEADNDMRLTAEPTQALLHRLLLGATTAEAHGGSPPTPRAEEVIRAVQTALQRVGHPDQKIDGALTRETVEAIRSFERAHNLKVTGRISGELVAAMQRVARDGPVVAR